MEILALAERQGSGELQLGGLDREILAENDAARGPIGERHFRQVGGPFGALGHRRHRSRILLGFLLERHGDGREVLGFAFRILVSHLNPVGGRLADRDAQRAGRLFILDG